LQHFTKINNSLRNEYKNLAGCKVIWPRPVKYQVSNSTNISSQATKKVAELFGLKIVIVIVIF